MEGAGQPNLAGIGGGEGRCDEVAVERAGPHFGCVGPQLHCETEAGIIGIVHALRHHALATHHELRGEADDNQIAEWVHGRGMDQRAAVVDLLPE